MRSFVSLLEMPFELVKLGHQLSESIIILFCQLVGILFRDKMVKFVPGFILEHLSQKLRRTNVCVEVFLARLDGGSGVPENHSAAPLAVFELN